ncbi:MAG: hypothetical protein AB4290_12785 [Spirulina sp.]
MFDIAPKIAKRDRISSPREFRERDAIGDRFKFRAQALRAQALLR